MGAMKMAGRIGAVLVAALMVSLSASRTAVADKADAPSVSARSSSPAGDTQLVGQIAAHLAQAGDVRARFTQTQTRAALRQPLVGTGSLLFSRERGVIWQIDTPYRLTYVITDGGFVEVHADGRRVARDAGQRGVARVAAMMRAMLGGDLSALYSQFDVRAEGTPAQWRMQLTPNQPQIAQSIKRVEMGGGEYLDTVRIVLANGDATQLDFAGSTQAGELTPAERTLFGVAP